MSTYPQLCNEIGLDCETCTNGTARNLAKVCKGLRGKMIGQLFVQIHSDPACAKMHAHFAQAYLEASGEARKPVVFEPQIGARPAAMAAVA
jgi:hypothetical protein